VPVHFLSPSIVHRPLFQLQLTDTFTNRDALGDGAVWIFALLCVYSQQRPYALANLASAPCFDL
jgi:hypothetical protein